MWYKSNPAKTQDTPEYDKPPPSSKPKNTVIDLRKTVAVLSIPRSHGGVLLKNLKQAETKLRNVCNTKVKLVEQVARH